MTDDLRLQPLLDELFDSDRTPEEVCRSCPELLPAVRERWRRARRVLADLDALFPPPTRPCPPPPCLADLPTVPGYEVEAGLGRGGMGVVYRARHLRLERPVALKMLLAGAYAAADERERFRREAELLAGLRHPNVVHVYDAGEVDGRLYFTMELVEGGNLAQKLAGTPQPARQAAALVAALAGAVQAAHAAGIVHRDLKPSNVLIDPAGVPRISDFGLARRVGAAGLTHTGAFLGTPSYVSPEQAQGLADRVGPAADIYALGAILYELLTGRPPFRAETEAGTIQQVISQEPAPPSRLNSTVPRDLETVCLKCLRKEPRLRYASAAALADDLGRFLRGEAVAARPERRLGRLLRRVRRHPLSSAALAAAALLAFALVGGGAWTLAERRAAARAAEAERSARERAAEEDLSETVGHLRKSSWPEARAALERAKGRLGEQGSAALRRRTDRCARELRLATRLEEIRLNRARSIRTSLISRTEDYEEAFRGAGLGEVYDDPEAVAGRVRATDVSNALVDALDNWSVCTGDARYQSWVLSVARRADPDPTGWRDRARDPAVRADQAALAELVEAIPVADQPVQLLLALEKRLRFDGKERLLFLKRVQQAHPGDYWANLRLGDVLTRREQAAEAVRYYQAAVALRPKEAVRREQAAEAVRYYQAAVALRPGVFLGHFELGSSLARCGRTEEAVEPLRRAVAIDPSSVHGQALLAACLTSLGRHDEAVEQLREAVRVTPDAAGLRTMLGQGLEDQGRYPEALPHRWRAAELEPKNRDAQGRLRAALVRLGRGEEARSAWEAALRADPPGHDEWYGYAEFCLFLGREDEYPAPDETCSPGSAKPPTRSSPSGRGEHVCSCPPKATSCARPPPSPTGPRRWTGRGPGPCTRITSSPAGWRTTDAGGSSGPSRRCAGTRPGCSAPPPASCSRWPCIGPGDAARHGRRSPRPPSRTTGGRTVPATRTTGSSTCCAGRPRR